MRLKIFAIGLAKQKCGMRFYFQSAVSLSRETVFAFFENPARLELLHAGWSRIRLLRHGGRVEVGAETWVEVTIARIVPVVLGFRHTVFEPPIRFAEQTIHGPFSRFSHIHEFEAVDGKTIVRDLLEICLSRHYGGETAMRRILAPQITRIFEHRADALNRLVADGTVNRCIALKCCGKG